MSVIQEVVKPVKAGQIYYASWGYDQTNIEFAKVLKVSPTGKTVICVMMSQKIVEHTGFMAETVIPDKEYGKPFRLRIKGPMSGNYYLKGSYPFTNNDYDKRLDCFWLWNEKPKYQSHYA